MENANLFIFFIMAKQTLVFETPRELSLEGGMIAITDRDSGEIWYRSIEDIGTILVDNHSVRLTIPLLTKLATLNVGVIFCDERHMPVSMLMDLDSNSLQSKRFQCQLSASIPTKKQLWKQIVTAKIKNQSMLLEKRGKGRGVLLRYYSNVKSGDSSNREGVAAKAYWKQLLGKDFIRDRYGESPNNLLNYGYALLRAYVARYLMNAGLLPTVGIFHRSAYNSFPLADDVMEPYRPYVDMRVMELFTEGCTDIDRKVKKSCWNLYMKILYRSNCK